ncbi:uncharacterized protein LOC136090381 [Hydra vulgaris]|uniref:Uncharacterized protein LOC136090381 n=1 Tax=Hydra vulgaris TaxID=6087 RepID=A0ABM4DF67_HYDVU
MLRYKSIKEPHNLTIKENKDLEILVAEAKEQQQKNVGEQIIVVQYLLLYLPIAVVGTPNFRKFISYLFITFTCDPKWREITENLYSGHTANDRPDLVTRVFKLKLNNLLNDIFKHGVLGKVVTHVQVIEFQKLGLPHVHILLHFANNGKLETAHDINNLLSAEIPDPIVSRDLYDIVKTCMIHGPCGILNPNFPCMKDGVCSKNYPKEFNAITLVPNNPCLSKKYQAHIYVEACMSVKTVKYLYKYIYKGHDCANILINEQINHDEVNTFLYCRYVMHLKH